MFATWCIHQLVSRKRNDVIKTMAKQELSAPIIGIVRHRLATDGKGVTTLVAFHSCP